MVLPLPPTVVGIPDSLDMMVMLPGGAPRTKSVAQLGYIDSLSLLTHLLYHILLGSCRCGGVNTVLFAVPIPVFEGWTCGLFCGWIRHFFWPGLIFRLRSRWSRIFFFMGLIFSVSPSNATFLVWVARRGRSVILSLSGLLFQGCSGIFFHAGLFSAGSTINF